MTPRPVNRRTTPSRSSAGPRVPLYLHDLAELLHAHLTTHPSSAPHYPRLCALFKCHDAHLLHISGARCLPGHIHTQHLYQGCVLFMMSPELISRMCQPVSPSSASGDHQRPPVVLSGIQLNKEAPIAALALLVLLYASQPPPQPQHSGRVASGVTSGGSTATANAATIPIRLDPPALKFLNELTATSAEGQALVRYIVASGAVRLVAQLRHAAAVAPEDLSAAPMHPLVSQWEPRLWYGFSVPFGKASAVLETRIPICNAHVTSGQQARLMSQSHDLSYAQEKPPVDAVAVLTRPPSPVKSPLKSPLSKPSSNNEEKRAQLERYGNK